MVSTDDPLRWDGFSVAPDGVAVIRMALILGDRLAVTHSQLLDGRVFLALGPDGYAQVAAFSQRTALRPLPLRVALRARSLEAALADMVRYPRASQDGFLDGFEFSSLPDDYRETVRRGLTTLRVAQFDEWRDEHGPLDAVVRTLAAAGLPPDVAARYKLLWSRWVNAEHRVEIVNAPFSGITTNEIDEDRLRSVRLSLPTTGLAVLDALVERIRRPDSDPEHLRLRSDAYAVIRGASIPGPARGDLVRWVDELYVSAQARQAGGRILDLADYAQPDESRRGWRRGPSLPGGRVHLRMNDQVRDELVEMPPEVFASARYRVRDAISAFAAAPPERRRPWNLGQRRRALVTIAATLVTVLEQPEPRHTWRVIALKVVLSVITTLVLVLDFPLPAKLLVGFVFTSLALLPELQLLASSNRRRLNQVLDVSEAL